MPVVASITARRGGKWLVLAFDEGTPLRLPAEKLPSHVAPGSSLEHEEYLGLRSEAEFQALSETALRILGRREHFTAELRRKLEQRGSDKPMIAKVLTQCRDYGYLDDARAAAALSEGLLARGSIGPLKLKAELFRRGCPSELAEATLQQFREQLSGSEALQAAVELARRRLASRATKELQKIGAAAAVAEAGSAPDEKALRRQRAKEYSQLRQRLSAQAAAFLGARGFGGETMYSAASRLVAELMESE